MKDKDKFQKILQIWNNDLEKEVPFKDIANEIVSNPKRYFLKENNQKNPENNIFYDKVKKIEIKGKDKPVFPYAENTALHRDLGNLVKMGKLKRRQHKGIWYYRLDEKYKMEPLKISHKKIINNCYINNVLPTNTILFYLPYNTTEDFTYDELDEIKKQEHEINLYFSNIHDVLKNVSLRKANIVWKKFIDKINCDPLTKFFGWLYLINLKIKDNTKNRLIFKNGGLSYYRDEYNSYYRHPKTQNEFLNDAVSSWNTKFDTLFYVATENYLGVQNQGVIFEKVKFKFDEIIGEIDKILCDETFFMAVTDSYNLNRMSPTNENKLLPAKIQNIIEIQKQFDNAMEPNPDIREGTYCFECKKSQQIISITPIDNKRYYGVAKLVCGHEEDLYLPLNRYQIIKQKKQKFFNINNKEPPLKIETSSFFSDNKFFDSFNKEIAKLYIDKEKLYDELDKWASIFYMPTLPERL
jgi:hypothetical protein